MGLLFKKFFPNMLSKLFLHFILDMGVTGHDNIIDNIGNKKKSSSSRIIFKKYVLW